MRWSPLWLCPLLCALTLLFSAGPAQARFSTERICLPENFTPLYVSRKVGAPLYSKFRSWLNRSVNGEGSIRTSNHPRVANWRNEVKSLPNIQSLQTLKEINRLTNHHVRYIEDFTLHGKTDFWNTPHNTLVQGGDCEDIALLKASALYFLGWPSKDMHLLVGHTIFRGKKIAHAVLAVKIGSTRYILDSLSDQVIPYHNARIQPAYALNPKSTVMFSTKHPHCKWKRAG